MDSPLNHAPCGFISFGKDGTISDANATLLALVGYGRDELLGRHLNTLLTPAGRIFYQTHMFPLLRLQGYVEELYLALRSRGGADIPVLINASLRDGDGPQAYQCVVVQMRQRERFESELLQARRAAEEALRARERADAELQEAHARLQQAHAELQHLNERLEHQASTDALTGLKNRRAFQERLAAEIASAQRYGEPFSLILGDVDRFKTINDTYGHPVGDRVLVGVGQSLQRSLRKSDVVARIGGEEFAVLLPQTCQCGALELAERLRAAVAAAQPEGLAVTISMGVASLSERLATEHDLLLAADQAVYRSKALGRDRVSLAVTLDAAAPAPLVLATAPALRAAAPALAAPILPASRRAS